MTGHNNMNKEAQLELPATKKQRLNNGEAACRSTGNNVEPSYILTTVVNNNVDNGGDKFGNEESYSNVVNPAEVEWLKEFIVLDEVKSNDEVSAEGVPEVEAEKMLDADLPDDFKGAPKQKEEAYIMRQKSVLEEKGLNFFELPQDWIVVRHISGMPIYMHRATRVVTLSKPYFLGKGKTRRHEIPISAIPCFAYRRAIEEEEKQKEIDERIAEQIRTGNWSNSGVDNPNNNQHQSIPNNPEVKCEPNNQNSSAVVGDNIESNLEVITVKQEVLGEQETTCPFLNSKVGRNTQETAVNGHGETKRASIAEPTVVKMEENRPEEMVTVDDEIASTSGAVGNKGTQSNEAEDTQLNPQPVVLPGGLVMPPPRVETINTSWKTAHLNAEQINDYCKQLFKFKTVNIMHFK